MLSSIGVDIACPGRLKSLAGGAPDSASMSPMSADADLPLAREALRSLGHQAKFHRVATGLDSTYRAELDDGRRVAVRVAGPFDFRRPEATLMEAAWVRAIGNETNLRVPEVLAPTETEPLAVVDREGRQRGIVVLSWIDGHKMRWRFATHHAHALGAAAAQLHQHAREFVPPPGAWAKTWSPAGHVGSGDRAVIERIAGATALSTIDRALQQLENAFNDLDKTDWMLVNGDLGPHNVVWERGRAGLFDFNDLGWGYAGFDLGRYLHGLRWRPRGEALTAAALAGYQSTAELPTSFVRYGRLFEAAAGLFLAHYLADKVDTRGEDAIRTIRDVVDRAAAVVG